MEIEEFVMLKELRIVHEKMILWGLNALADKFKDEVLDPYYKRIKSTQEWLIG